MAAVAGGAGAGEASPSQQCEETTTVTAAAYRWHGILGNDMWCGEEVAAPSRQRRCHQGDARLPRCPVWRCVARLCWCNPQRLVVSCFCRRSSACQFKTQFDFQRGVQAARGLTSC